MIEIKNLKRVFNKKGHGIQDVSFDIPDGSILAFIGDNGAGKTTTIQAISSELKLQSGEILLDGTNIFSKDNMRKIAFFPDTDVIPKQMTINEYVRYVAAAQGIRRKEMEEKVVDIYAMLGLEDSKDKKIKELSAGLKKRGIMAAVLLTSPKYIFFDEPTANLDIESKLEFQQILKLLNQKGVTILITSHLIEELQEVADQLVLIKEGQVVYQNKFNGSKERMIDVYKKFTTPINIDSTAIDKLYGGTN